MNIMDKAHKVAKNIGYLSAGRILSGILQIFIVGILARLLGVDGYGKYSFAIAYVAFFNVLGLFLDTVLIREISRSRDTAGEFLGSGMIIKTFFCYVGLVLSLVSTIFFKFPQTTAFLIYLFSLSLLFNIIQTPRLIFEADLQAKYISYIELIDKIIIIFLLLAFEKLCKNIFYAATAILLSDFITAIIFLLFSRKFVIPKFNFNWPLIKKLLHEGFPLAILAILSVIYLRIDTIMLSFMKGYKAVGYYNGASTIIAAVMIFPDAYARSIFPVISAFFHKQHDRIAFVFVRSLKYLAAAGAIVAIIGCMFSKPIVTTIMGASFASASASLSILSISSGIIFISALLASTITAINQQHMNMWFALVNVGVNIVLNYIFISMFSYTGAAAARLATEMAGCFLALFFLLRYFNIRFNLGWISYFLRLSVAALLTIAVAYSLASVYFPFAILISLAVYFLFLILLRWFDKEDIIIFQSILKGKQL